MCKPFIIKVMLLVQALCLWSLHDRPTYLGMSGLVLA